MTADAIPEVKVVSFSPPISPKQMEVLMDRKRFILLSGARYSTKTVAAMHKLCLHAWETNHGAVTMIPQSVSAVKDEGTWSLLTEHILPTWFAGGFGMRYTMRPKRDVGSGKIMCAVSNRWGNTTKFQIDSLVNEQEVESKFKGKNFSAIYVPELSNFHNPACFQIWADCLRRPPGYPDDDLLFLGDTNPAEEGEDSWIYKLWFQFRLDLGLQADQTLVDAAANKFLQSMFSLHTFTPDDNPWMSQEEKEAKRARYLLAPHLYDRLWLGLWKKGGVNGVFQDVFHASHIVGGPDEEFIPQEFTVNFGSGWDIGSANKAILLIEPVLLSYPPTARHPDGEEKWSFLVHDELIELNSRIPVADMTEAIMEKIAYIERQTDRKLIWSHVSDRSAFEHFKDMGDADYEYKEIYNVSEGKIELTRGPVKSKGSVRARVNLLRKLFMEDRILIAGKCRGLISALSSLMPGKTLALDASSPHKHAFDALTYFVGKMCYEEMISELREMTKKRDKQPRVVEIPV